MNTKKLRHDFPIFGRKDAPAGFIYLDSAATAQKPQAVIEAVSHFYTYQNSNIARGVYDLAEQATELYEGVREKTARFLGAASPSEIVFTGGATEAFNLVAETWGRQNIAAGDEIVITQAEHHANLLPWQRLARESGATLRYLPVHPETFAIACSDISHAGDELMPGLTSTCSDPSCDIITSTITEKTKLVSVTADSNVLGGIWAEGQLEQVIARAKAVGARVMLDGAQAVCHKKMNVQELGIDFLAIAGHKLLAPTGVGVLYIKKELHEDIEPYQLGGSMVYSASFTDAQWQKAPHKFEAGTPPIAQVVGLGAAIDYYNKNINFEELQIYEAKLAGMALDGLLSIEGITVLGDQERIRKNGHLISFVHEDHHPHDIASCLDMRGVAIRAGHHCAQPLVHMLGHEATLRVSLHCYNTPEDVEVFIAELIAVIALLNEKKGRS